MLHDKFAAKKELGLKTASTRGQNLTFCRRSVLRHRRAVGHRRVCPSFNLSNCGRALQSVRQIIPEVRAGGCISPTSHQLLAAATTASALQVRVNLRGEGVRHF